MKNKEERLVFYMENKGFSNKYVAGLDGKSEGQLRNAILKNNLKLSQINVICSKTDLNKEWLLTGEGQMINDPTDMNKVYRYLERSENVKFDVVNEDFEVYGLSRDELKTSLLKQIEQLEEIIKFKNTEIKHLKSEISNILKTQ